jgi:hypothetical protein
MSNIIDQAVKIIEANGFKDSMLSLPLRRWVFTFSRDSDHPCQGQTGGHRVAHSAIRHYYFRMDGLLSPIRVNAGHCARGSRPVPQTWGAHFP